MAGTNCTYDRESTAYRSGDVRRSQPPRAHASRDKSLFGMLILNVEDLLNMAKCSAIWKTMDDILDKNGPGPFSTFLISKASRRGKKLEQLLRIVSQYKKAMDTGVDKAFIQALMFKACLDLNK